MIKDTAYKTSLIGVTAAVLLTGATLAAAAGKLNVSNWAEYMAEDTIANFAKEYDIEITFTPYDSVEAIDSKLLAGNSGYDVVSHSGSSVARLLKGNILKKIDKSKLSNFKHMSADVMAQLGTNWDPGHNYMVPYMWGTHGVTFNKELVLATYPDAPIGDVDMIFNPEHMEKLAKCGVAFLDSPDDVISLALGYLGLDPNSTNRADYKKVAAMLKKFAPISRLSITMPTSGCRKRNFAWPLPTDPMACWRCRWRPRPKPVLRSIFICPRSRISGSMPG